MNNRGFTLVETVIVMGIVAILMGITTISVLRPQRRAGLNEVVQVLLSDLRSQQTKAMTGVTVQGAVPPGFGVYFETNRYILFSGASYNPSDPANTPVSVQVPNTVSAIRFAANTVVFLARSGEISGYTAGGDSVTIAQESGQTKTIQMNRYGVVVSMD